MGTARGAHRPHYRETPRGGKRSFLLWPGADCPRSCERFSAARLVTEAARCNPSVASEGIGCSIGYRDLSYVLEFCALSRSGLALGDRQSQRDPASDLAGDGADNATRKHRPTCPGRTGREHEHRATASASAERIPVVPEMQPFVVLSFFPQPLVIPGTPKAGEEPAVRLQRPNSCQTAASAVSVAKC